MSEFIGLVISIALLVIGFILLLIGFIRFQDLWFAVGGCLLGAMCLVFGVSPPPFVGWWRFVTILGLIGVTMLVLGILSKRRLFLVIGALWAWFWLVALRGYARGSWTGILLLSVSSYVLPIVVLRIVSRYLLPLRDKSQQGPAFKSLLAAVLGTNHPYYVIRSDDWGKDKVEQKKRMGGSPFAALMAGPGVVVSHCDHAPVVSDGVKFKGAKTPGLNFTGYADAVPQAIDLREQLRAFFVEARTKDGINIEVLAFTPFRIDSGEQVPRLGQSFPFRASAVFNAVHQAQLIEHTGKGQIPERTDEHLWDDLPRVLGTRILRDIIAQYRFDDLCAPYHLAADPRVEIATRFRESLRAELHPFGIRLTGGGISNLLPAEKDRRQIFEQRIRRWQVHWVRQIMQWQAEGQASRIHQVEKARAQAQVEVIQAVSDRLAQLQETRVMISPEEIVDLFIRIIGQMAARPLVQQLLPTGFQLPQDRV